MPNTALNRTTQALLTNKSGGALNYGDVVVLDNTNANGFTTTTSAGLSTRGLGVILEPLGIANNASGMVAIGGWVPQVNLNTAAAAGQFIKTHTVAGQGTPHASPQVEGDFAVALAASATPAANLFGSPNGPLAGGAGTVTHTAGNLTANAIVLGNAVADITVLGSLGTTATLLHGNAAGAPSFGQVALASEVSGDLPFANLTQIAGLSVLGVTGSATADVAAITAATDGHVLTRVSSSSVAFSQPGMQLLETQTPSATGTVTFSSLGAFTHLEFRLSARSTLSGSAEDVNIRFNADTGGNYDSQLFYNSSDTAAAAFAQFAATSGIVATIPGATATANRAGGGFITVSDYRGTTFDKVAFSASHAAFSTTTGQLSSRFFGVTWRDVSAITSVTLFLASGNYVAGSLISAYGYK